jgi:ribulose-phosphate 3-epimerase
VLDVHLMIDTPIKYAEEFCKAGADYLTIHVEADTPENIHKTIDLIRALGVKPGVVVKPNTPAEAVAPYLEKVDMVLVMTVEPGFGGQEFMAHMMPKLKELRRMLDEKNPACHLEVDGGVDLVTAEICKENGADVLVAGSAFFGSADRAGFVTAIEK